MLNNLQKELDTSIKNLAENSLLKKLRKEGIERADISSDEFAGLLELEIDIIKSDGKKVGTGIAVGIGLSILSGGLI